MANYDKRLDKFNFSALLKEVLDRSMKPDTIINRFKRCGLSPFNVDAVYFTNVDVFSNSVPMKANDCNQNRTQTIQPHKSQNGLKFLEQFIGAKLLTQFNETYNKFTPIWDGAESAHDLFVVWRTAKDLVSAEVYRTNSNSKTSTEEPMIILDNFESVAGPSKPIDFNEPVADHALLMNM